MNFWASMSDRTIIIYDDKNARKPQLLLALCSLILFIWVALNCGPNDTVIFITFVFSAVFMTGFLLCSLARWNVKQERIHLTEDGLEDIRMKTGFIPYKEIGACCIYRSHDASAEGVALELRDGSYGFPERKKLSKGYITFCRLEGFSTDDFYVDIVLSTQYTTMSTLELCNYIREMIHGNQREERDVPARKANSLTIKEALLQGIMVLSFTALLFAFVLYFY